MLVHGFTQTGRSWDAVADHLVADHEVVAVDAPGHGGSAAIEADLPDGAALLGATGGRATYVGYSMGGRLCLHLAVARPDLVERLVLVSATAGIDDPGERQARRDADEALAGDDRARRAWRRSCSGGSPSRCSPGCPTPTSTTAAATPSPASPPACASPAPAPSSRCGRGCPTSTCPVLLVAGADDPKFVAAAERMAGLLPRPTLAVVADAGHTVHLEQPAEFLAVLDRWLAATA